MFPQLRHLFSAEEIIREAVSSNPRRYSGLTLKGIKCLEGELIYIGANGEDMVRELRSKPLFPTSLISLHLLSPVTIDLLIDQLGGGAFCNPFQSKSQDARLLSTTPYVRLVEAGPPNGGDWDDMKQKAFGTRYTNKRLFGLQDIESMQQHR